MYVTVSQAEVMNQPTFGCLSFASGHERSFDRATMIKAWMINSLIGSVGLYVLGA